FRFPFYFLFFYFLFSSIPPHFFLRILVQQSHSSLHTLSKCKAHVHGFVRRWAARMSQTGISDLCRYLEPFRHWSLFFFPAAQGNNNFISSRLSSTSLFAQKPTRTMAGQSRPCKSLQANSASFFIIIRFS